MAEKVARPKGFGWLPSLLVSGLATGALIGLMFWARSAFQIRTLPERIMEWILLFVPLEAFEKGLQQFGSRAKDLALSGGIGIMIVLLIGLGLVALRRFKSGWAILALGVALWLFAMLVVMPLTGGGLFATGLFQNPWLVNASYLGTALAYATVLLAGRALASSFWLLVDTPVQTRNRTGPSPDSQRKPQTRRPLLVGALGLAASYLGVAWFARQGTAATSDLPLAQVKPQTTAAGPAPTVPPPPTEAPVTGVTGPTAVPKAAPTFAPAKPASQPTAAATAAVASGPAPTATPEALPVPPPPRALSRDKDGSLTAAGRRPGELPTLLTSNQDFYVVTKNAGGDPLIKPGEWRCVVDGEVNNPVQLDYRSLRQLPTIEVVKTLECISNFTAKCELTSFGCDLISTARFKGPRLRDVLELAGGVKSSAVALAVLSTDEFSSSVPIEAALDPDTILAYEMNGEVLPYEHGYPARLLVPGRYGFKSAKWVMVLRPMNRDFADWYSQRNWNKDGIVKTMARIDAPAPGAELPPSPQRIAGIAYGANRGVRLVEFSADGGGTWRPASFLEPQPGRDAWVRWQGTFTLAAGETARLVVRATDGTGAVQTETFSLPQPDGASGRHDIEVKGRA